MWSARLRAKPSSSITAPCDFAKLEFVLGYAHQCVHEAVLSKFGSAHEHHDDLVSASTVRQIVRRVGHRAVGGGEQQLPDFPFPDNVHCDIASLCRLVLSLSDPVSGVMPMGPQISACGRRSADTVPTKTICRQNRADAA